MWSRSQDTDPEEARAWGSGWQTGFYRLKRLPSYTDPVLTRAYYDGKRAGREAWNSTYWFSEQGSQPKRKARKFIDHALVEQFRTQIASGRPMAETCKEFKFSMTQGYKIAKGLSYQDAPGPIMQSTSGLPRGRYVKTG